VAKDHADPTHSPTLLDSRSVSDNVVTTVRGLLITNIIN
jgi:hypothetical protein